MSAGYRGGVTRKVRLYYTGTNPSASALTVNRDGTATADTIGSSEQLLITAFEIICATGGAFTLNGGSGVDISKGTLPSSGGGVVQNNITRRCLKGATPTITAAAGGQVDVRVEGEIIKAPTNVG